jgi:hypothetical protein
LRPLSPAFRARAGLVEVAVAFGCALVAAGAWIGADARWLPALGRAIVDHGGIPDGVPFASAPSAGWPNVPVLAELILDGLNGALGERGLLLAQLAAVAAALAFLAADMRRGGATEGRAALVLAVIVVGALPALLVIRAQLFSLVLFPALVALLRAEARAPSARVWLLVPMLALWSNLHGAVLVGLVVAGGYLLLQRARPQPFAAAAVLAASAVAVCATPALQGTPDYYLGVLRNEAARRGEGLWSPLSPTSPFDLLLLVSGIALVALAFRARPMLWEAVVLVVLAALSVRVARNGVWLLSFAGTPAARGLRLRGKGGLRLGAPSYALAATLIVYGLVRGPLSTGAGGGLIDDALQRARGTPILAQDVLAEQVALAGGRIWMGNPLDAFHLRDQRLYLDWVDGRASGDPALEHAPRVVLVRKGSDTARRMAHDPTLRAAASDDNAVLYVRRR